MDLCCQNNGTLNEILFREEKENGVNSNNVVFFWGFFSFVICVYTHPNVLKEIAYPCKVAEKVLEGSSSISHEDWLRY